MTLYDGRRNAVRPIQPVSQEQYIRDLSAKSRLYFLAFILLLAGVGVLPFTFRFADRTEGYALYIPYFILSCSWRFLVEVAQIKPVRPVNVPTSQRFSPREILLRPSELPPSQQKAELLRAAQSGQETAPKELLRAAPTIHRETGDVRSLSADSSSRETKSANLA